MNWKAIAVLIVSAFVFVGLLSAKDAPCMGAGCPHYRNERALPKHPGVVRRHLPQLHRHVRQEHPVVLRNAQPVRMAEAVTV